MAQRRRDRPAHRERGRGHRPRDPRPAQLHLRAAPGDPRRPPARPGPAASWRPSSRSAPSVAHDRGRRRGGRERAGGTRGRRGAAHARGAVERRPPRLGHVVPDHACGARTAAPSSRSTTTGSASTSTDRPGDGARRTCAPASTAGRRAHDRQRRGRGHDGPRARSPSDRPGQGRGAGSSRPGPSGSVRRGGRTGSCSYCTTSAVTIPNMPSGPFDVRQDVAVERPRARDSPP